MKRIAADFQGEHGVQGNITSGVISDPQPPLLTGEFVELRGRIANWLERCENRNAHFPGASPLAGGKFEP
jgi:hypothetical protein